MTAAWSPSDRWCCSPPPPEMPGCWTRGTISPRRLLGRDPLSVHMEETDTTFAIGWQGQYRIDGAAFVYADSVSGRVITILGYPTQQLSRQA